jgi:hypothetical protein
MKIRMGFVSNSSSTSYCVIGEAVKNSDFFDGKIPWEEGMIIMGGYNGDGELVQNLDEQMYNVLLKSVVTPACKDSITIVRRARFYDSGTTLGVQDPKAKVYAGECTINTCRDINDFEDAYINGEGIDF